jgi:hypothetical protein
LEGFFFYLGDLQEECETLRVLDFPLSFGQSTENFNMEPNTGVSFDHVAGVEEK